ncbi:hypothetical protein L3Q82_005133 [Scortum barcoo]|uniref:Uncharacterized protein n=1 Tax=Scortum barcoo TaxID=214431 RepID=A0ACB8VH95_9TELE|nr:hypothetical protein L3Q82_005133 [Scortum barcoo]
MFEHKGVHQCTWHQDTLGRRSMIDFVVSFHLISGRMSWTLWVKRGAELSTDHHLVVSWIRWQRRKLDRPGRPKRIVRVCWERLAEPSVREVFNSHLRKSFSQIPREAGDIQSKWTMFSASIVDAAVFKKLWTQGLWCLSWRLQPRTRGGHRRSKGCRQAEEWSPIGPCWPVGLLTQLTGTGRQAKPSSPDGPGGKNSGSGRSSVRPCHGGGLSVGLEEILANRPAPQKGEAVLCQHCLQCRWGAVDLDSGLGIVGRWKKYFLPTCLLMRKRGWGL